MSTLVEKIRKPQSVATFRVATLALKAEPAEWMAALVKITGLPATKLVIQILTHTLETDPGIKKLLSEAALSTEKPKPLALKQVSHG